MTLVVGDGIRQYCDDNGLNIVTNEWTEKLGDSTQAKVWTDKGLIISSPDSGDWQTVGPFGLAG